MGSRAFEASDGPGGDDLKGVALDEENNRTLLTSLDGVADTSARYVCVAAYVAVGLELTARGETLGIDRSRSPRQRADLVTIPTFSLPSSAERSAKARRRRRSGVSHRGRAFRELLARIKSGR